MSLNWIFAFVAIGVWIVASLLYLRGPITRRIVAWRKQRAEMAAARAAAKK